MAALTGRLALVSPRVLALAAAAPLCLGVARLLPETGVGLALRLLAATVCVLVLPGALILRAFAWPTVPALALTGSVVLSLAVAMAAFAVTFATAGTVTLALVLIALAALAALVPAAFARVGSDEPGELLALGVLVAAALVYGCVIWWVAHSLGTGDVLFHLARARKIADGETLGSLNVVNEFRDGGLHPGYAFPAWHGVLAAIARLAGVDVSLVVLHVASVLVVFAFAAAYAAGRALFGSWIGGVAVLAAQVAQLGFSRGGTGTFQALALPTSVTRAVLVPALLALLFAYLRERDWRLLVPLAAASLAVVVVHPSYLVFIAIPITGFTVLLVALWKPRREAAIGLATSFAVVLVAAGLFLAWLQPTVASTASFRPSAQEEQRALEHYGDQLQVRGDGFRAAPEAITDAGPVVVAALVLLPLAALGARRRWGAYAVGGMLLCLAVLLIPDLFARLSDVVSISQSRRLALFLPVPFAVAAAAVVVGRARVAGVALALGGGIALELVYSAGNADGPVWPLWVAVLGGIAGIAVAVVRPVRLDVTRWAAFAVLAFVAPVMVGGLADLEREDAPDPYSLTPGVVSELRALDDDSVVLAPLQTSYRVAAFAPVYVAAMPAPHVANTEANLPYRRQRDALNFFSRGKLDDAERRATLERYGAGWLLVDKHGFYPKEFAHTLPVVYEDGRYALYRVGAGR
jgi:hypothetical protein